MPIRTFKQTGLAFANDNSSLVTVVVTLDNQEIFSGNLPESLLEPHTPVTIDNQVDLFSWQKDTSDNGVFAVDITVSGGTLKLGRTLCTYPADERDGAEDFGAVNMVNHNEVLFSEPFSNVVVDNTPIERTWEEPAIGQWHWHITSRFSANFTVPPVRSFE